jgi:hypothetical protein
MKRVAFLVLSIILASTQSACTMQRVAPPGAPTAWMPDVGDDLPPSGSGYARVVIGTDVPARVGRVALHAVNLRRAEAPASFAGGEVLLCAETPCAITLPYGDYELVFKGTVDAERVSHARLSVRRETVILNHTLGRVHTPAGQHVAWGLAGVGVVLLGVAYAVADRNLERTGRPAEDSTLAVAATGLGTMVLGGIVGMASPGTTQDGSSTQWSPRGPTVGATVGLRF